MKKFIPFLILISLLIITGISIYNLNKKQSNAIEETSLNDYEDGNIHFQKTNIKLPDFSLPNLYDETKTFSKKDLLGHYSIINFFASWCTTCHAEHQILLSLSSNNLAKLYGITWRDIDYNSKHFLEENGNPFEIVGKDSRGVFTKIIGLNSIPETIITNPEGDIVMRYRGNLQEFSIDEIAEFLKKNQ